MGRPARVVIRSLAPPPPSLLICLAARTTGRRHAPSPLRRGRAKRLAERPAAGRGEPRCPGLRTCHGMREGCMDPRGLCPSTGPTPLASLSPLVLSAQHGYTALHWATVKGQASAVEVLLQQGASTRVLDAVSASHAAGRPCWWAVSRPLFTLLLSFLARTARRLVTSPWRRTMPI